MIPADRLPPRRLFRLAATLPIVAFVCIARPALAADPTSPIEADTAPGMHAMEQVGEGGAMDHGDRDKGAANRDAMNDGALDRGATDHGAQADISADADARATGRDDTSTTLAGTSAAGLYRVELRGLPDPVPLNRMHEWIVHVETGEGVPVTGASISMMGGMPIHDHGLPTVPRVTAELGGGDYRLEGVRFQMGGRWVVELVVDGAPGEDSITFDLDL